jgi:hypothetical protein
VWDQLLKHCVSLLEEPAGNEEKGIDEDDACCRLHRNDHFDFLLVVEGNDSDGTKAQHEDEEKDY